MTKWEYRFVVLGLGPDSKKAKESDPFSDVEAALDAEGSEGWEAVSVIPKMGKGDSWTFVLMKRPSP